MAIARLHNRHIHCALVPLISAQMEVRSSHVFLYKVQPNTRLKREKAEAPLAAAGETQMSYRSAGWRAQCHPVLHYYHMGLSVLPYNFLL